MSIEQMRKLGLSDEQITKIAEARRDIERERAKLADRMKAAQDAAKAANEEVSKISTEMRTLLTVKLEKAIDSIMTPEQSRTWHQQLYAEQARGWLQGYKQWLKLSDAQVEDIAGMLAPVFEKYDKVEKEMDAARDRLLDLRKADQIDLAAIDKVEKEVAANNVQNVHKLRQEELMDKIRAGLMPDQLEKFDQVHRRGK
jgi:hypothetical protein